MPEAGDTKTNPGQASWHSGPFFVGIMQSNIVDNFREKYLLFLKALIYLITYKRIEHTRTYDHTVEYAHTFLEFNSFVLFSAATGLSLPSFLANLSVS